MKKIKLISAGLFFLLLSAGLMAQGPPNPPGGHGESGDVPGGNAPIGAGLVFLLGMGAVYGGRKAVALMQGDRKK